MRSLFLIAIVFCFVASIPAFASEPIPSDQEAEQIEAARKFVERLFVDPSEESLSRFPMSDGMKRYFSSDTFREWMKAIADDYGKPGRPEKIEVVRLENGRQEVLLFCHCNRYPITMSVTFDAMTVDGFHWGPWKGEPERVSGGETRGASAKVFLFILGSSILCFLIVFIGERQRNGAVKRRWEYWKQLDFDPTSKEIYREMQDPFWCYVLLLAIFAACVLQLMFIPAIPVKERLIASIILAVVFLPLAGVFGFYVAVDNREIVVRMGWLRIPIKRIPFDAILSVEMMPFRPLRDFGGWGIRYGKGKTTGYFMSGNQGALVTTRDGKKHLLGSDTPARLMQVIRSRLAGRE